jgi:hypothetical protein
MKIRKEKGRLLPVVMSLLVASGTMLNSGISTAAAEANK